MTIEARGLERQEKRLVFLKLAGKLLAPPIGLVSGCLRPENPVSGRDGKAGTEDCIRLDAHSMKREKNSFPRSMRNTS